MRIVMWKRFSYAFALVAVAAIAVFAKDIRTIDMRDDCDQATFNAAFGAGTCIGDGDTTVDELFEALADGGHEKWRFNNERTDADRAVNAKNEGGETHTFTPVARFGGGFIPDLNMGEAPVPECAAVVGGNVVPAPGVVFTPAGGRTANIALASGTNRFQCCIHPWMRSTVIRN